MDDPDIYDFTHPTRGIAVIINNEVFKMIRSSEKETGEDTEKEKGSEKETDDAEKETEKETETGAKSDEESPEKESESREGSSKDADNLESTFNDLGFLVLRYDNLTASDMVDTLESVSRLSEHETADCFVCAVLSHGCSVPLSVEDDAYNIEEYHDVIFGTDTDIVPMTCLTRPFRDDLCQGLIGKPKLFFVQACRGIEMDGGVDISVTSTLEEDEQGEKHITSTDAYPFVEEEETQAQAQDPPMTLYPPPLYKDFLLMYATPPGYTAWRSIETGSWFVQELCSLLTPENTCSTSLTTLLTKVSWQVALSHRSLSTVEDQDGKKQVPCLTSMLTRDVYFRSHKQLPVTDL